MTDGLVPMPALPGWAGDDPVVRAEAAAHDLLPALTLRHGETWAVAFLRPTHTHGVSVMLRGVEPVLRELVGSAPFAGWLDEARSKGATAITLPRTTEDLGLIVTPPSRWEFMSTARVVPAPRPDRMVEMDPGERDEVEDLLEEHNPGTDGQPFVRPGQRWVGVRAADGSLLAVGCCEPELSGAPVLAGITVVPAARGLGLGRAVTAELTRRAVAEHGWCTLGMYSHNARARGVYRSLGYEIHAEWSSGRLG